MFDGYSEVFENQLDPPDITHKYYDDMVYNRRKSGELPITFVHFGKEQSYPNRSHINRISDSFMLHYITEGCGEYNGRRLTSGMGFAVFPGEEHTMIADSSQPWHFYWMNFDGSFAARELLNVGISEKSPVFEFSFFDALKSLFNEVIYSEHSNCDMDTYMLGCFYILMSYHRKQYLDTCSVNSGSRIYAVRTAEYIDTHYGENIRIENIAAQMHISRKYLCQVFREYTGMSPKEYLLQRRIDEACTLLTSTDMAVPEIAKQVGYNDYTQLSQLFRRKKGMSPLKYRKNMRD